MRIKKLSRTTHGHHLQNQLLRYQLRKYQKDLLHHHQHQNMKKENIQEKRGEREEEGNRLVSQLINLCAGQDFVKKKQSITKIL